MHRLLEHAIRFFTNRRTMMEKRLHQLGEQFDSQQTVEDIIQNKEKVSYYEGLFVLYDPFPCIESCPAETEYHPAESCRCCRGVFVFSEENRERGNRLV